MYVCKNVDVDAGEVVVDVERWCYWGSGLVE